MSGRIGFERLRLMNLDTGEIYGDVKISDVVSIADPYLRSWMTAHPFVWNEVLNSRKLEDFKK